MVPSIGMQENVMIECLQNHTPDVLVIDEIGRKKEVMAALTVKQRGVRIVASAHGNLVDMIKNKELNGLIGGVESVLLGDEAAKENHGRKMKAQRLASSIFDVIIELKKGDLTQWNIITNVSETVDAILQERTWSFQTRKRDQAGRVWVEHSFQTTPLNK
uniref:Stage III sporulation protein AA AAA+ ATPase domain-containing protein n=1 Tax=Arcella intermedia TaxID=1963864 RepID=A0A6B2LMX8_9EUKA